MKPFALSGACGEGEVITDFASITNVNWRAFPLSIRSVYFEVSSRANHGSSPSFRRRSHFTQTLPSQPGTTRRAG